MKPCPCNPDTLRKALTTPEGFEYLVLRRRLREQSPSRAGREAMEVKWLISESPG